jgi:hypothetical protein
MCGNEHSHCSATGRSMSEAAMAPQCNKIRATPKGRSGGRRPPDDGLVGGATRQIFVIISKLLYHPRRLVNFYLVRFWSARRSGVTLTTTHKAGFFDPGGWHSASKWARVTGR